MKNRKKLAIIVVIVAVLVIAIGFIVKYFYDAYDYKNSIVPIQKSETKIEKSEDSSSDYRKDINASSNIVTVLILGIDRSDNRTLGIYRSDINAIVRANLETNQIKVLNIPRDTYTFIPIENKKDKIAHAYAVGSTKNNGIQASIDAVNSFFGEDIIDYYFVTDMDPVPKIVDGLGGIEIDVETRIVDTDEDITIEKGLQILHGKEAVSYLQWRHTPRGDIDRIEHFHTFLSAMYKQVKDKDQIMDLVQLLFKENYDFQMNLSMKQIIGFAAFFKQLPENSVTYYTLNGNSQTIDNISYWVPADNTDVINEFLSE